jgi:hypothetical protein
MICISCEKDQNDKCFINSKNICYHCVYRKKREIVKENKIPKTLTCRLCKKAIYRDNKIKKRQRTVFCSDECARIGQKEKCVSYWTRQVGKYI